ncbi:MAG: hypothetical protein OXN89_15805 [Bryobacterales bacterium]|nr:hypothetical protein [Bryobacterales bacterium]
MERASLNYFATVELLTLDGGNMPDSGSWGRVELTIRPILELSGLDDQELVPVRGEPHRELDALQRGQSREPDRLGSAGEPFLKSEDGLQ